MIRPLVASVVASLAVSALAQKDEADVRAFYTKLSVALGKYQPKVVESLLEKHLAPDFKSTFGNDVLSRRRYIADLKATATQKGKVLVKFKVVSVKKVGAASPPDLEVLAVSRVNLKERNGKEVAWSADNTELWTWTPKGYRLKSNNQVLSALQ